MLITNIPRPTWQYAPRFTFLTHTHIHRSPNHRSPSTPRRWDCGRCRRHQQTTRFGCAGIFMHRFRMCVCVCVPMQMRLACRVRIDYFETNPKCPNGPLYSACMRECEHFQLKFIAHSFRNLHKTMWSIRSVFLSPEKLVAVNFCDKQNTIPSS